MGQLKSVSSVVSNDVATFAYYTNLVCSGRLYCDLIWREVRMEMAMATFLAFLATARDEGHSMVVIDDGPHSKTQPGGLFSPLSVDVRKSTEKIEVSPLLRKQDFGSALGYVAFHRFTEILWSDDGSIGWSSYL